MQNIRIISVIVALGVSFGACVVMEDGVEEFADDELAPDEMTTDEMAPDEMTTDEMAPDEPGKDSAADSPPADSMDGASASQSLTGQNGARFLVSQLSGRCIDVTGTPGTSNGSNLQLHDCEISGFFNGTPTDQQWEITSDGFIRNALSGRCLDVAGAPGTANATNLGLHDCEYGQSNTDQRWEITSDGFIRNMLSGRCVDVAGAPATANGANLELYTCEYGLSNTDQRWFHMTPVRGSWSQSGGRSHTSGGNPRFRLSLDQSQQVQIDLGSNVDTYLYLLNAAGNVITYNDDGGPGLNSRLTVNLAAGDYILVAATFSSNQVGEFQISASQGDLAALAQGSWAGSGGRNKCSTDNRRFVVDINERSLVELNLMSSVDTYMYLLNESGDLITYNDDGGAGLNSRLTLDLDAGEYVVVAATYQSNMSGLFDLTSSHGVVRRASSDIGPGTSCTYRIRVKANNRYLHEDGLGDKLVSTRWQDDDDFTRFHFYPQSDGTYRIRVKANNRYLHEDGLGDKLLSTRWQPNDNFTRFYLEVQGDGAFRIRVKANNRYLHEDGLGDKLVSTRWQDNDDFTRFYLQASN